MNLKSFAILILLLLCANAFATYPEATATANSDVTAPATADAQAESASEASASSNQSTLTKVSAPASSAAAVETNGPLATVGGDNTAYTSSAYFFSADRSLPMANGCWGSYDGGGSHGDGKKFFGGFLGFQILNHDCFMNQLAEEEMNAEVRALLQCDSRRFRNAIAYKVKDGREAKQDYCVMFMKEKYLAEIEWEKETILAEIEAGKTILRETPKEEPELTPGK